MKGPASHDDTQLIVQVQGAVLPAWFVAALLAFLVFTSASLIVLYLDNRRLDRELRLLQDYTEGRVGHLPYRPTTEERIEP